VADFVAVDPTGVMPVATLALMLFNENRFLGGVRPKPVDAGADPLLEPRARRRTVREILTNPDLPNYVKLCISGFMISLYPFISDLPLGVFVLWFSSSVLTTADPYVKNALLPKVALISQASSLDGGPGSVVGQTPKDQLAYILQKIQAKQGQTVRRICLGFHPSRATPEKNC